MEDVQVVLVGRRLIRAYRLAACAGCMDASKIQRKLVMWCWTQLSRSKSLGACSLVDKTTPDICSQNPAGNSRKRRSRSNPCLRSRKIQGRAFFIGIAIALWGFGTIVAFAFMDPVASVSNTDGKRRIYLPAKATLQLQPPFECDYCQL